jgi:hypothetical protein
LARVCNKQRLSRTALGLRGTAQRLSHAARIPYVDKNPPGAAMDISRLLIWSGLVILLLGLLWPFIGKLGPGQLPGDILIRREHGTFYFPIVTCLLISAVISLIFWLLNR